MVSTRGKKNTTSYDKSFEEAAEHVAETSTCDAVAETLTTVVVAETLISDSVATNVEEHKIDSQVEDKVDITDEANSEKSEGISEAEEENENVTQLDNDNHNALVTEMNGDSKGELEENTFEDDEIDDQEDMLWEHDEENDDHDSEERVINEYDFSDEEATEEDNDDDVSEEEPTEEDDYEDEVGEEEKEEEEEEEIDEDDDEKNHTVEKEIAKPDATKAKAKKDGREAEEHNKEKLEVRSLKNIKKSNERARKDKVQADKPKKVDVDKCEKVDLTDKPESSRNRKVKKRVESMGMIFMCSSRTKKDCYQYKVLGLPEGKKDLVQKIYTGMRLFLYDLDLKLLYGIYKAAGPGGYNIEPKAFKSQFPSQVRFKVLDNCLPLAEEKFKTVIKENYYTKTKFHCQLNSEQVKKLCKLFVASSKGHLTKQLSRKAEKKPLGRERMRKRRAGDERHLPLREGGRPRERPRKRPRKGISPRAPARRLPAPLPSIVPSSYVYERTSDVDAYRRDPYSERRSPYRDRHDPLLGHRDPYADRQDPPLERNDHYRDGRNPPTKHTDRYRDGRDPYLSRNYDYRDRRDLYIERRDPYKDDRDPYPSRRRDPYLELPDLYRDRQDPYIERHDSYRDGLDSFLDRHVSYRDNTHSELYSTYRRDPLSLRRDTDGGVEYRDPNRLEELLERRDIASRDLYVSTRGRPSYTDPIYPAEYPSRSGVYRL